MLFPNMTREFQWEPINVREIMNLKSLLVSFGTVFITSSLPADPSASAFTYQGRLAENGVPVDGLHHLRFRLYNAAENGSFVGPVDAVNTPVSNGLFNVTLDWGPHAPLLGYRWVEVEVSGTVLHPRQYLTSVPFALSATRAEHAETASAVMPFAIRDEHLNYLTITAIKIADGEVVKSLNGQHDHVTISAGENVSVETTDGRIVIHAAKGGNTNAVELGLFNSASGPFSTASGGTQNSSDGEYSSVGGGVQNVNSGNYGTIAGGIQNTLTEYAGVIAGGAGNGIFGWAAVISGGQGNKIGEGGGNAIGGGYGNATLFLADSCTIAGGWDNLIGTNALSSTIAGGQFNRIESTIDWGNHYAAIGGGAYNEIHYVDNAKVTIAGGYSNRVEGSSAASTIAGGEENTILDSSHYSTIAGGKRNVTRFLGSAVGGGENNKATGYFSAIPGGRDNEADGYLSFAAGEKAQAMHPGSFVWADASGTNISSSTANEFTVRASGGVRFFSSPDSSSGVILERGSGSWSSLCDRNAKTNIAPVDAKQVLEAVANLPIATWSYKSQANGTRHIGPMAQDFHAAFHVGENERHISTVDATGVSLAAIQGLHELVRKQEAEIETLKKIVAEMKAALVLPERN